MTDLFGKLTISEEEIKLPEAPSTERWKQFSKLKSVKNENINVFEFPAETFLQDLSPPVWLESLYSCACLLIEWRYLQNRLIMSSAAKLNKKAANRLPEADVQVYFYYYIYIYYLMFHNFIV